METPEVSYYGPTKTPRTNARREDYPKAGLTLWYSYDTVIAFRRHGLLTVCENAWSTTTGKHLNAIDGGDKANRLRRDQFLLALHGAMDGVK